MSRFDDDIDRDLSVIAERVTPSHDAWAEIQQRIADREPDTETEIIMLVENQTPTRRWPLMAAAAAVIILVVGAIALVNRGDGEEVPATPPAPTLAPAPDIDTEPDAETEPEADTAPDVEPAPEVDTAVGELPPAGTELLPGTYRSDAIGVPVTFDLQEGMTAPWTLVSNEPGGIQLVSDETGREFMAIGRVGSYFDATEARTEDITGLGSIPADDLDGWIEANGVIVVDSADIEVGSRAAKYRLIRLDTTPGAAADFCPPGEEPCLWAATGSADLIDENPGPIPFGRDRVQALWQIDMDEFEPVFIFAAANLDDDEPWFTDIVQPIVDSVTFGEPAPVIPGGTARVPLRLTETGAFEAIRASGEPLADGSVPVTDTITIDGNVVGEIAGVGVATIEEAGVTESGVDEYTFTGTIDEVGTGTITYTLEWQLVDGVFSSTGRITGGTGDFAGVTGTTTTSLRGLGQQDGANLTNAGTITFFLVLPRSG